MSEATVIMATREYVDVSFWRLVFGPLKPSDGLDEKDFDVLSLPLIASNIIKLAGFIVQIYWLKLKRDDVEAVGASKLENLMRQLWAGHLTWDDTTAISLLQDATEVRISPLDAFVQDVAAVTSWNTILSAFRKCMVEYESAIKDTNLVELYGTLVKGLPVLRMCSFDVDRKMFSFGGNSFPAFPYVCSDERKDLYGYFHSLVETDAGIRVVYYFPYLNQHEELQIENLLPEEQKTLNTLRADLSLDELKESIVYLFGRDFSYLRNLAGAITSTTNNEFCRDIYRYIKETHAGYIDESLASEEDQMLVLLIKVGPENLLTNVFMESWLYLDHVLEGYLGYLEKNRGVVGANRRLADKTVFEAELSKQYLLYTDVDDNLKQRIEKRLKAETAVWCLMSAAGFKNHRPVNLGKSLGLAESAFSALRHKLSKGRISESDMTIQTCKLFENILCFLVAFYEGLRAYHQSYREHPNEERAEVHEEMLVEAVKHASGTFQKQALGTLVRRFRDQMKCEEILEAVGTLLGRPTLCDIGYYNSITSVIPQYRNGVVHRRPPGWSEGKFDEFLENSRRFFAFLKDGRGTPGVRSWSMTPVYPLVISFQESRICRGGIEVYSYRIFSIEEEPMHGEPIKILTPLRYSASDDYYCIPRCDSSSKEYWIEPLIVRCDAFDHAFVV